MTAQKWVFSLVISEGQKLYRADRNHPGCLLKEKAEEAVSTDSDSRKLSYKTV